MGRDIVHTYNGRIQMLVSLESAVLNASSTSQNSVYCIGWNYDDEPGKAFPGFVLSMGC